MSFSICSASCTVKARASIIIWSMAGGGIAVRGGGRGSRQPRTSLRRRRRRRRTRIRQRHDANFQPVGLLAPDFLCAAQDQ